MSWNYVRAVLEMEPTWKTPAEFAVLIAIADHARGTPGVAYPSKPTIGRRVRLGRRQVWNVTRRLEEQGHIRIEEGAGPRGVDRYVLLFRPAESRKNSGATLATDCQGDAPSTVATDCQGQGGPVLGHLGNVNGSTLAMATPLTLAINNADPGNGIPRPGQSIATNPVDPKNDPQRDTVRTEPAPAAHAARPSGNGKELGEESAASIGSRIRDFANELLKTNGSIGSQYDWAHLTVDTLKARVPELYAAAKTLAQQSLNDGDTYRLVHNLLCVEWYRHVRRDA